MSKLVYERPVLIQHQMGLMNKFGHARANQAMTHIDGVAVSDLLAEYGSPLFVFSERTLVDRYREMRDAFARRWNKVRIAWSYKTNYLGAICRTFHREGAWAEIVSEFEFEKALSLGVHPSQIHFNGPHKNERVLERVLPAGTLVHLDNFDELAAAERVSQRLGIRPGVAIRINMSAEGAPCWNKFGFNLESGQAWDAIQRLLSGNALDLVGLHCHLGTFIQSVEAYREQASRLAELANTLRSKLGVTLSFIDIGGGMASRNTLKAQYLPGEQATPSFSRYAEAVYDGLSKLNYPPQELPTLVLEHGRALVDDAGTLLTTVQANKRLPDGRRGVIIDAGVNTLFTSFWYKHDICPAQPCHGLPEPTVVYGPLCMNIDVIRDTMLFPPLQVGDQLVIRHVGAYNVTQWMQFITYRPAVVMIGRDGQHHLIRRRETLDAITSHEVMPHWLED